MTGFFGIVFESDRETGYSIQRLWGSVAFAVLFVCTLFFDTLWLLLVLFIVTMPMFLVAEWKYGHEMKNSFSKCQEYYKSRYNQVNNLCEHFTLCYTGQTIYSLLTSKDVVEEEVQDDDHHDDDLQDVTAL